MLRHVRPQLVFSLLALLCAPAPGLLAQAPAAATDSAEKTETDKPKRSRAISGEVAAALAAGMPKYDPPKPVEPKPEEEQPDLRETDKPRNKIIRLPEYVVREKKPPVFTDRDLRSLEDRGALKFPGLNASGMNKNVAREMIWDAQRKEDMAAFSDLAGLGSVGDPEQQRYYKKLQNDTYIRSDEAATGSGASSTSWAQRKAQ